LLANVSQSPPFATGLLLGNQSQVAGDLFAAVNVRQKPFDRLFIFRFRTRTAKKTALRAGS
jgi:hypothetical protein